MAHVDTPKGDLDASGGALSMGNVVVNDFIYPYGTTELYASQTDVDGNVLTNTAHEYRECSAKGICDRATGTCSCFEGYEGSACQRASCPSNSNGVCSGHGSCRTISEIANMDHHNVYKLWDEDTTMGCVCDGGFGGADCSEKMCKVGVDPLYFDNNATMRYSNWTYGVYTRSATATISGNYSLIFYDAYGEDWQTEPIPWNANCDELTTIIEGLPNSAVPAGSVRCYKRVSNSLTGTGLTGTITDANIKVMSEYILAFSGNAGKLKQIELNIHLDGTRPTLFSSEPTSSLSWYAFPNGFIGEDIDYVNHRCEGVTVNVDFVSGQYVLTGFTSAQARLLKTCLGDSDGDETNNVDVYNWDLGTSNNPHLIKLQDATQYQLPYWVNPTDGDLEVDQAVYNMPKTKLCTSIAGNQPRFGSASGIGFCANANAPGFYAVMYYDPATLNFKFLTNPGTDYTSNTPFFVYTTTGYLQVVSPTAARVFTTQTGMSTQALAASYHSNTLYMTNVTSTYHNYFGDMACETQTIGTHGLQDCINKNDMIMVLDTTNFAHNPAYPNIYTVTKISNEEKTYSSIFPNPTSLQHRLQIQLDYGMNVDYFYNTYAAKVFKFYPKNPAKDNADGGYSYAGPCSNRGNCNHDNGLCECYNGFTGDNCNALNALAK
jgi:hypothetical protein